MSHTSQGIRLRHGYYLWCVKGLPALNPGGQSFHELSPTFNLDFSAVSNTGAVWRIKTKEGSLPVNRITPYLSRGKGVIDTSRGLERVKSFEVFFENRKTVNHSTGQLRGDFPPAPSPLCSMLRKKRYDRRRCHIHFSWPTRYTPASILQGLFSEDLKDHRA